VGDEQRARMKGICQKPGRWGSVSANGTRVTLDSNWRDVVEEGYAGVEGLGSGERAEREGRGSSAKNQKTEPLGLGFG
jgi:hypothetical protein